MVFNIVFLGGNYPYEVRRRDLATPWLRREQLSPVSFSLTHSLLLVTKTFRNVASHSSFVSRRRRKLGSRRRHRVFYLLLIAPFKANPIEYFGRILSLRSCSLDLLGFLSPEYIQVSKYLTAKLLSHHSFSLLNLIFAFPTLNSPHRSFISLTRFSFFQ